MPQTTKEQLEFKIIMLEHELAKLKEVNALLQIRTTFADRTERRFDQLLEAMSFGMKEAVFPRRPH